MYFDRIPNSRLRRVNELMNKPPLFPSRVNDHVIQEHLNKSLSLGVVSCELGQMAAKLSGVAGQLQGRQKHLRTERQYCLEVQVGYKESGRD